tara:strand:+ start:1817 stop:2413 length:597 start_codon:yes stop_codon:yes gene_type:complete
MILNLIKLGIVFLLKTYCQNIVIKKIDIKIKSNLFKGKVERLLIEAEKIIYRNIHLNYAKINALNLEIDINRKSKFLKVKDFNSHVTLHLNKENLKNIINSETESDIKKKIREFTIQNNMIEEISFINKLITFDISKDKYKYQKCFALDYENNDLILLDINSKKTLFIKFEKEIIFNSLKIDKDLLRVELTSKVRMEY